MRMASVGMLRVLLGFLHAPELLEQLSHVGLELEVRQRVDLSRRGLCCPKQCLERDFRVALGSRHAREDPGSEPAR